MEKHVEDIVKWLRERTEIANAKGLLVGVSGGLDSAVVANLIKKAYPDNSLGVVMPIHSSEESIKDAFEVTGMCEIEAMKIDLSETHNLMYKEISKQLEHKELFSEKEDQLANANLRARLRMSALYTVAAHRGYLVVGTDNKAEWYTGYFTKHGDGGVDILPLNDFTKTEVREMARYLGVPSQVIEKVPSADLWEEQSDEVEMGVSYHSIDAYLNGETVAEADKQKIKSMHKQSQHKREPLPAFKRHG